MKCFVNYQLLSKVMNRFLIFCKIKLGMIVI